MGITRREFATGAALGALTAACSRNAGDPPNTVNDITQLNPIRVARIVEPRSVDELAALIRDNPGPISIGGGRFSQGGQTACDRALFVDMRPMNKITLDEAPRTVTAEAGATWRQIQEAADPKNLSPKIMQSFSNFTLGGSLSVNCHGDYVGFGPVVESVRSIRIVTADGAIRTASRQENADLFAAAIGGYGGVGVIADATLDLAENTRLERVVDRMTVDDYPAWHSAHVLGRENVVLHHAVVYPGAYNTVAAEVSTRTDKPLTVTDRLAPLGEPGAFQRSLLSVVTHAPFGAELHEHYDPLIGAEPEVVWRNYEAADDVYAFEPESRRQTTYALEEYFVPIAQFTPFVMAMAQILRDADANVLNVAIRHTRADPLTLLSWAREDVYSFVLYYAQGTTRSAKAKVGRWTRALIDAALAAGGSFYLPYQIHATRSQFLAAYPRASEYFALKARVDPDYKFRNRLWKRTTAPDVAAICASVGSLSRRAKSLCSAPHIREPDSNPSASARPEDDATRMSFQNHNERREAAEAAKKAMLDKFKTKATAPVDPEIAAQRAAEAKAREEKRIAGEQKRRERVELEKLERKLAAEAKAQAEADAERFAAEDAVRKAAEEAEAAEIRAFEQKARRDLKYAARKARQK